MEKNILMPPDIRGLKKALFIQPHPDDNEIGAGGTILRMIECGCEVFGLTVTDGAKGWGDGRISSAEVADTREEEAKDAFKITGMQNAGFLRFADQTNVPIEVIGEKIVKIIDEIKPEGVFTVDPYLRDEWHDDHIKTGKATIYAVKNCIYSVKIVGYFFTDMPNTYVDVTKWQKKKWAAIYSHKSQINEEMAELLKKYFIANKKDGKYVEPLRILGMEHTHCWNLPFLSVSY